MAVKGLLISMVAVLIVAADLSYPYRPSGYIGCFQNRNHTILSKKLADSKQNSGDDCKRRCHGYRYAGTEFRSMCFCGNYLHRPLYTAKTGCNYQCPGSKTLEYCGGSLRLSLYDNLPSVVDINCSTTARTSVISVSSKTHKPTSVADSQSGILTTTLSASTATDTWSNSISPTTLNASTATDTWSDTVSTTTLNVSTTTDTWSDTVSTTTLNASTTTDTWSNTVSTTTLKASTATDTWPNTISPTTLYASTEKDTWPYTISTATLYTSTATNIWSNTVSTATLYTSTATDTWSNTVSSGTTVTEAKQYKTKTTNVFSEWITVNNTQFHVVETKMDFSNALEHCRNMNAQLILYTNPLRYFMLPKSIGLKTHSYWIGAFDDNLVNKCPTLVKNGTYNRIRLEQCSYTNPFICSRTANVSKVADDHDFADLLKDMTIDVKKTNKAKGKLISAGDRRRSATVVGGTGIIVLCIFVAFVIFADINWKRCQCVSKRKNI